jgi:hypothetical protein
MKKIFIILILFLNLNCLTFFGKSETAEAKIQATAFVGLLGDFYAGTLIQPPPYGLVYGVLCALFYLVTDGGISDRYGRNLEQE